MSVTTLASTLKPPPPVQVHYLWFAFVCFLIRSHTPPVQATPCFMAKQRLCPSNTKCWFRQFLHR